MDELFRRAAENYPLDTNSADWNKVLSALQGEAETKTVSEKSKNTKGRFLWLLLLLPLGLICNQLYSPGSLNDTAFSKTNAEGKTAPVDSKNIHRQDRENTDGISRNGTTAVYNNDQHANGDNTINNSIGPSARNQKTFYTSPSLLKVKSPDNNNTIFSGSIEPGNSNDYNTNDVTEAETLSQKEYVSEIDFQNKIPVDLKTAVSKSFNPLINSSEQNSRQNIKIPERKNFYAGVVGGIDATTIKFQKIEHSGLTYGALLGYQLNKKWSIETGVYFEKKYYYSDGEYFNASKIYPPPSYARVDNISGDCKMFEIPVSVKYNFSSRKNSGWFATVGTSSYFMKKESYSYDAYYGSGTSHHHDSTFRNSSSNVFSAISISGGYSHRLGDFADLRIEPYLKIPVSGMGIGSLPLLSTGLQVGIIRKF